MRYPIVLHTDDGIRYGVTVPDLPGCFSAGDTFDDALDSAREAIDLHAEGLAAEDQDLPVAHAITEHRANPDYASGVWAVVDVDLSRYQGKAEKINITIPRRLLVRVDEYARARGESRSGFLARAAQEAMRA
ncbi:MAG: type II toxin-antitoxin system HicB family antitoxin [Xanthomonadales bacterium]|jgi:predicted RNase H-like HicB family nuclease|nr:type II toxin-antitoxin system HicB family antitoxin [Xanthomonadales bacterium]MCC6559778.1 type II toxin-antitoxin system HicB family antitoxin [Xanthomonadales bacterium]